LIEIEVSDSLQLQLYRGSTSISWLEWNSYRLIFI